MRLKESILKKIKESYGCKREIEKALGVTEPTMCRYLQENSDNLTKINAVNVICNYFNETIENIFEDETKIKAIKSSRKKAA